MSWRGTCPWRSRVFDATTKRAPDGTVWFRFYRTGSRPHPIRRGCGSCGFGAAGTLQLFSGRWMHRIPVPLTAADRDHGCWRLSMRQIEVSRTLVSGDPRRVRAVCGELPAANMNLGRPESARVIFGSKVARPGNWELATRLPNRPDQVTVSLSFKHSRIKVYLKEDRAPGWKR